jgi:hypothetical protein
MLLCFTIVCKKIKKYESNVWLCFLDYDLNQKTHWECVMQQNEQPQKFR